MLFDRKKTIDEVRDVSKQGELKKTLGVLNLFLLGLGAMIGAGIFVYTGIIAPNMSGPSVVLSFFFSGIASILIALAYTEVATMIPSSGASYSYAYVAFGEFFAFLVAALLVMYLFTAASSVAVAWSQYLNKILDLFNIHILPASLTSYEGIMNLPAIIIVLLVTALLVKGTKESALVNDILVVVKIAVIAIFIIIALPHFNIDYLFHNGIEYNKALSLSSEFMPFGLHGTMTGAGLAFFAYNGFDGLASAAEECKNPERDLKKAILSSIIVCMLIYMVVAGLLVGITKYNELGVDGAFAYALNNIGSTKGAIIVAIGAFAGLTTVILFQLFVLSRVLFAVARDGLFPKFLTKVHKKFRTPYSATIFSGLAAAIAAGFLPLDVMGKISSVGAISAFVSAVIAMMVLRIKSPDHKRPFKCPAPFLVGAITILFCGYLITTQLEAVGKYVGLWLAFSIVVYFIYSRKNSKMV